MKRVKGFYAVFAASRNIIQFRESDYRKEQDPFEGIKTNKTFQEISNEIAMSTPFGKNSSFYKPTIKIIKKSVECVVFPKVL